MLSGRIGSDRVGSGRVGSGRVGSGRVGSGRIGSDRVTLTRPNPTRTAKFDPTREQPFGFLPLVRAEIAILFFRPFFSNRLTWCCTLYVAVFRSPEW